MSEVIQKQATKEQLVEDHINSLNDYDIAEKYGMDIERVKVLMAQYEAEGAYVPKKESK